MRGIHQCGAGQPLVQFRRPSTAAIAIGRPGIHRIVVHASGHDGSSQIAQGAWTPREQLLVSELVATRHQVDRLLEHQQVLLNLLAAQYSGSPITQRSPASSAAQPTGGSLQALTNGPDSQLPSATVQAVRAPSGPSEPGLSPVTQLLNNLGAVPAGSSFDLDGPASSSINDAVRQVAQQPSAPAANQASFSQSDLPELPVLKKGDCSAWWMEKLHVALLARGYYSGDEDVQSWNFGQGTARAVERFQQDEGLNISSVSDAATWASLLSELPELKTDMLQAIASGKAPAWRTPQPPVKPLTQPEAPRAPQPPPQPAPPPRPSTPTSQDPPPRSRGFTVPAPSAQNPPMYAVQAPDEGRLSFNPSFAPFEGEEPMPLDALEAYYASAGQEDARSANGSVPPKTAANGRPPEMESGDVGGFFMETLHAALLRAGCDPTFREMDRTEFGQFTLRAVKRFQNAANLPITGRVDDVTWALLLKDEADLRSAFVSMVAFGVPVPPGTDSPSAPAASTNGVSHHTTNGFVPVVPEAVVHTSPEMLDGQHASDREPESVQATPSVSSDGSSATSQGLPPVLHMDDDDILWVSRLHQLLTAQGFYPPDDECADWLFGPGTQEAVLTAQASAGLAETGVVCVATWSWLMRDPECEVRKLVETELGTSLDDWAAQAAASAASEASSSTDAARAAQPPPGTWPVIMEGDGNEHVGLMQRALDSCGYNCGEDEPQWWQCGSDTINALRTFQACAGLPETGVCDGPTWRALAHAACAGTTSYEQLRDFFAAQPGDGEDQDLTRADGNSRVWLLGEQRWETRKQDGTQ